MQQDNLSGFEISVQSRNNLIRATFSDHLGYSSQLDCYHKILGCRSTFSQNETSHYVGSRGSLLKVISNSPTVIASFSCFKIPFPGVLGSFSFLMVDFFIRQQIILRRISL